MFQDFELDFFGGGGGGDFCSVVIFFVPTMNKRTIKATAAILELLIQPFRSLDIQHN